MVGAGLFPAVFPGVLSWLFLLLLGVLGEQFFQD